VTLLAKSPRAREAAALFRSLANPNRFAIALALAERGRIVAELEADLEIRQPILSQQLAILRDAGLVETRKEQKSVFYALSEPCAEVVRRVLCAAIGGGEELGAEHAPLQSQTMRNQVEPSPMVPDWRAARRPEEAAVFARVETLTDG
jgi:DNA-binding transcriptional ArsR family regulator